MNEKLPIYTFSPEKNLKLKLERDVSFEEIIAAVADGQLLDIVEHPNQKKYNEQKMYIVFVNNYVYIVPFVENKDGTIFLKTIIPSRKAKKTYMHAGIT